MRCQAFDFPIATRIKFKFMSNFFFSRRCAVSFCLTEIHCLICKHFLVIKFLCTYIRLSTFTVHYSNMHAQFILTLTLTHMSSIHIIFLTWFVCQSACVWHTNWYDGDDRNIFPHHEQTTTTPHTSSVLFYPYNHPSEKKNTLFLLKINGEQTAITRLLLFSQGSNS